MKIKRFSNEIRTSYCPICKKESGDNPHFSINLNKKKYFCHVSGQGGNVEELEEEFREKIDLENIEVLEEEKNDIDFFEVYSRYLDKHLNEGWEFYLKGRGISLKTTLPFCRIGKYNTLAIPLVDNDGRVAGIKYRTLEKKCFSEKGSTDNYLLGWNIVEYNQNYDYLIIVEGEIDLLTLIECGYNNVVSLPFGANNVHCITHQKEWLRKFKKIILALDNDEAGKIGTEKIKTVLNDFNNLYSVDYGSSKDFNEVLTQDGKKAVKTIIKRAKKENTVFSGYYEGEDGYYNGIIRITDFKFIEIYQSKENFKGIVSTNGIEKEFYCSKKELLNKQGIAQHLGYYLGSNSSIANFWAWIAKESIDNWIETIDHYGIIDGNYYDYSDTFVECPKLDLNIIDRTTLPKLSEEDKEWLKDNIYKLRSDFNQSLLGVCWALGRFTNYNTGYPLLEVAGTTSVGKSEFIEFICRLTLGNKENIKNFTTLTAHQIRSISSCSNITCWAVDEIKITSRNLQEKANDLTSIIRSVFDNKTINQGNTSNKLTVFKLCTPMILSGETEIMDVSMQNRMLSLELTKQNKGDWEVFKKFKEEKYLESLGSEVLDLVLNNKIIQKLTKLDLSTIQDERQLFILKNVLDGLNNLLNVLELKQEIVDNFASFLIEKTSKKNHILENFKELLELVLESGGDYSQFLIEEDGIYYVRLNLFYKCLAEEHRKTNSTLELLDLRTLTKQLKDNEILKETVSKRVVTNSFTGVTQAFKFKKLNI